MTDLNSELPIDLGLAIAEAGEPVPPSLARSSAARFVAEATGLVFVLLSGIIVARGLGPAGKGLFASLTLVSGIIMWVCSIGLGDAAVVMVGQRKATVQAALSVTIMATLVLSVAAAALFWGVALVAFRDDWGQVRGAAFIGCLSLPIALLGYDIGFVLAAQERMVAQAVVVAVTSVVTSIALVVFIRFIHLSVAGGMVANGVGSATGLGIAAWLLSRSGLSFRPRLDRAYLVVALRYGASVALAYVLTAMLARVDVLLTYTLAGSDAAGQYSVAIALSGLVGLLPYAITSATFPRLARVGADEATELTAQACRYAVAASCTAALALFTLIPIGLPVLFGRAFRPAIVPTLVLLPGTVIAQSQWLLCRAEAARGRPGLLVRSVLAGLVVMCGLDLLLIPRLGIIGASLSAVAGPAAGLLLCLISYRRSAEWPLSLPSLVPRPRDFRSFVSLSLRILPVGRAPSWPTGNR